MMRSVRRHPSEFRPETPEPTTCPSRLERQVPGQRTDVDALSLVDRRVGRGNDPFVHSLHFPW
jgi:hypothetical protein